MDQNDPDQQDDKNASKTQELESKRSASLEATVKENGKDKDKKKNKKNKRGAGSKSCCNFNYVRTLVSTNKQRL